MGRTSRRGLLQLQLRECQMNISKILRRRFALEVWRGLAVVGPVLTGLLLLIAALGQLVAVLEDWPPGDGLYFSFVTGLTIGFGDLVPKTGLARAVAMAIGLAGIVLTGIVVAVAVQALHVAIDSVDEKQP